MTILRRDRKIKVDDNILQKLVIMKNESAHCEVKALIILTVPLGSTL